MKRRRNERGHHESRTKWPASPDATRDCLDDSQQLYQPSVRAALILFLVYLAWERGYKPLVFFYNVANIYAWFPLGSAGVPRSLLTSSQIQYQNKPIIVLLWFGAFEVHGNSRLWICHSSFGSVFASLSGGELIPIMQSLSWAVLIFPSMRSSDFSVLTTWSLICH